LPIVLSEDFSAGTALEGVRFVNPFAGDFDLDAWLPPGNGIRTTQH
jgi:hypothetical protein